LDIIVPGISCPCKFILESHEHEHIKL
jgi:hypothetical protein